LLDFNTFSKTGSFLFIVCTSWYSASTFKFYMHCVKLCTVVLLLRVMIL